MVYEFVWLPAVRNRPNLKLVDLHAFWSDCTEDGVA